MIDGPAPETGTDAPRGDVVPVPRASPDVVRRRGPAAAADAVTALVIAASALALLVLVGGGIEWTRARRAELPAAEVVSLLSLSSLLSTGARFVVAALFVALAALAMLVAADTLRARIGLRIALVGGTILVAELGLMIARGDHSAGQVVLLVLIAVAAAGGAVAVYQYGRRLAWFTLSAFLGAGLFLGFSEGFAIWERPEAEPVAALVAGAKPIRGVFVAETDRVLYIGLPAAGPGDGRFHLAALPRETVKAVAVAPPAPSGLTSVVSEDLARELCATQPVPRTPEDQRALASCPGAGRAAPDDPGAG